MNIHDSLLSHETLSQVIKVPLIASWHIKLYGGLAWLGYMRAPPPPCRPGSGGGRRGPPPQRHHGVSCHISFRRWKANEVSLNGYDTSCIISWCFAGSDYICSYDPTTTAAAAACRQPGGGERHASLVVRQNHDPNGQCRGEPRNEIHFHPPIIHEKEKKRRCWCFAINMSNHKMTPARWNTLIITFLSMPGTLIYDAVVL